MITIVAALDAIATAVATRGNYPRIGSVISEDSRNGLVFKVIGRGVVHDFAIYYSIAVATAVPVDLCASGSNAESGHVVRHGAADAADLGVVGFHEQGISR